jgi:hypothetical protein
MIPHEDLGHGTLSGQARHLREALAGIVDVNDVQLLGNAPAFQQGLRPITKGAGLDAV